MSISEKNKRLRRWFQRRCWHTGNTPTGIGVWLEAPPHRGCTYANSEYVWYAEYLPLLEIDRFNPARLEISLYKREVFTQGPGFEKRDRQWPNQPTAYICLSRDEVAHLLELMDECIKEKNTI